MDTSLRPTTDTWKVVIVVNYTLQKNGSVPVGAEYESKSTSHFSEEVNYK